MVPYTPIGRSSNDGFAYLTLLVVLAVMAIVISGASVNLSHQAQREREEQLLFVGEQFYNAIESYYAVSQDQTKRYPTDLKQLLIDNRGIKPKHHLRKIFQDPITKTFDWGLVLNTQKQIIGVYSLSNEYVLKTKLPDFVVQKSTKAATYQDIKFIYTSKSKDDSATATSTQIESLLSEFGLDEAGLKEIDDNFDDPFSDSAIDPFVDEDF